MCGIGGIVDSTISNQELVEQSRALSCALAHRGPDESGQWSDSGVTLVHRRLVLLDHEGGQQPFVSPDKRFVLTYNGEIYNSPELRRELETHWQFRSRSDTEVLLAALIHWGKDALPKLNGMFSFFLWDNKNRSGFAARDLLGVKPFAYYQEGPRFAFASEAKALLPFLNRSPKVNHEAIEEYLAAPCFSGVSRSPFAEIHYLPPGHILEWKHEEIQIRSWGDAFAQSDQFLPETAVIEQLRETLPQAIQRSLFADEPIGYFLSGGLDSTLITCLAERSKQTQQGMVSDPTLLGQAFSIRFPEQQQFDLGHSRIVISNDEPFAQQAAEAAQVDLQFTEIKEEDIIDLVEHVAKTNDALPAWEQELAQFALARDAANSYRAVLVGDAADETHYGYSFLLRLAGCDSPANLFQSIASAPFRRSPSKRLTEEYRDLLRSGGHNWRGNQADQLAAVTYLIVKRWLPRLLHNGDIHTMAHGLEARVPFADTELLRIAERVSPLHAFRDTKEKSALREAAKGYIPESLRTRQKSALPKAPTGWKTYRDIVRERFAADRDWIDHFLQIEDIKSLVFESDPVSNEKEQGLLFRLACLGIWADHFRVSW